MSLDNLFKKIIFPAFLAFFLTVSGFNVFAGVAYSAQPAVAAAQQDAGKEKKVQELKKQRDAAIENDDYDKATALAEEIKKIEESKPAQQTDGKDKKIQELEERLKALEESKKEPVAAPTSPPKPKKEVENRPFFESYDQEQKSNFGIGVNYTGLHVRFKNAELKCQVSDDMSLFGLRYYSNKTFYPGFEFSYLTMKPIYGILTGGFLGYQKRFGNLVVFADAGIYFLSISDLEDSAIPTYSDFGMIINSGVTFYIF